MTFSIVWPKTKIKTFAFLLKIGRFGDASVWTLNVTWISHCVFNVEM
jgi:hypothetical protein